jgi:hypothetical protein
MATLQTTEIKPKATPSTTVKKKAPRLHSLHVSIDKADHDRVARIKRVMKFEHTTEAIRFCINEVANSIVTAQKQKKPA